MTHYLGTNDDENAQDIANIAISERDALREILEKLDAVFDFGDPINDGEAITFEIASSVNEAFDLARAALKTEEVKS